MTIRAKAYQNRKDEKKVQVTLDRADAVKLVKGDNASTESLTEALTLALKAAE